MPTTLQIPSISENNITERSDLALEAVAGAESIAVRSTEGFSDNQSVFVGALGQEQCEAALIESVVDETTVSLAVPLKFDHKPFSPVTGVIGSSIRIWRAPNVNDSVPGTGSFAVLATRTISPDQLSTYYTDSTGSSSWWYRFTYFNPLTSDETDVEDSQPVRGDDFGHYCNLGEIRGEAGLGGAQNLDDVLVDQQRRAAEAEVNGALGSRYQVPFVKPMPDSIRVVTAKLAAGFLLNVAYSSTNSGMGDSRIKDARALLDGLKIDSSSLPDDVTVISLGDDDVSSYDYGCEPRAFTMDQRF